MKRHGLSLYLKHSLSGMGVKALTKITISHGILKTPLMYILYKEERDRGGPMLVLLMCM